MAKTGRPLEELNQETANIICELIATSSKGLARLCAEYPELPDETTIYRWRLKHESFRQQYAEAKRNQAELLAQEIIDIADDKTRDVIIDEDGNEKLNTEFVARSRLRVDARKWVASKLLPKVYGDKQDDVTTQNTLIEKLLEKL
jgi:hypothetical protein